MTCHETTTRRPLPTRFPNSMEVSTRVQTDWPTSSAPRCSKLSYTIPLLPIVFSNSVKLACVGRIWSFWRRLVPCSSLNLLHSRWAIFIGGPLQCPLGRADDNHDRYTLLLYGNRGAQTAGHSHELDETDERRYQSKHHVNFTRHGIDLHRSTRQRGKYPKNCRLPTLCQIPDDQQCFQSLVYRPHQIPGSWRLLLLNRPEQG